MALTWEELELPVLQWVFRHGDDGTGQLRHHTEDRFEAIPHLTEPQVAEAIKRLAGHGLVSGEPSATNSYESWHRVRTTADGLRVLGEWPPAEPATVNIALARILRALADSDQLPETDQDAARRAAGTIASTAGEVVLDVVKDEMSRLVAGGGA